MRSSANVRYDQFPCPATVVLSEPSQHLRHPGTADAEVTGECRPALEVAGVEQRLVVTGEVERIGTAPDRVVDDGDVVMLGETRFEVINTGGHTLGHISFYDAADQIAFVGDTLFALGCGRLFEGTPQQMWASLQKLTALPDATAVYCAHEYTASNARFALSVDADPALKARTDAIFAAREKGDWTVPTSIGLEKATNPFLRAPLLRPEIADPAEAFGAVRAAKDSFKG